MNISYNMNNNASPQLIRKREKDLYNKQSKYWKKHYGLIVESEDQFKRIAPHTKEIKKVLHIIPLIKSLRFDFE